jgi:hypothetical protein
MKHHVNRRWRLGGLGIVTLALGSAFVGLASNAIADGPPGPPPGHKPPPEAFTACAGKASGDACSVHIHDHDVSGTCDAPPGETELACRPDRPPPPPQEAFSACDGKASGDACSVALRGGTLAGTCGTPPSETRLVCIPADAPAP